MAERFQRLFTLPQNQYVEGCPILIAAGALQKDTEIGKVLAQIKMRNIGEKPIASCKVRLHAFESNGNEVDGVDAFSHLDLDAKPGTEFGSKTPVYVPDATTRSFSVDIIEIIYADGSIDNKCYKGWKKVPDQKSIETLLHDSEAVKQYGIEVKSESKYIPEKVDGLFLCTCGAVNLESNHNCCNCGATYDSLIKNLHTEDLKEKADRRVDTEKKAAQKKKKKIAIIGVALILVIGIIAVLAGKSEYPCNVKWGDSYNTVLKKAARYSESGRESSTGSGIWAGNTTYYGVEGCSAMFDITPSSKLERIALSTNSSDLAVFNELADKLIKKYGNPISTSPSGWEEYSYTWEKNGVRIELYYVYDETWVSFDKRD